MIDNNTKKRPLGYIKGDDSEKDFLFGGVRPDPRVVGASPEATGKSVDLRRWCSPVEDQGALQSCVGNAVCNGLELLRNKNKKPFIDLSRLFVYWNAREQRGDQYVDQGSVIRYAVESLNKVGCCGENVWPYDESRVFERPAERAYETASRARVGRYERIDTAGLDRVGEIRTALEGGLPVVFGMYVTESFLEAPRNGVVRFRGPNVGGHAMLIVGYNSRSKRFIVKNSWSSDWGSKGYCFIHRDDLDQQLADDFWVLSEAPGELGE